MMTVNCGRETRDWCGRWDPSNARELFQFDASLTKPVAVWGLGNEINGYPFVHGPRHFLSARRYCDAFALFAEEVRLTHPESRLSGPASAWWPVIGEPNKKTGPFLRCVGGLCDIVTWHYYPIHSHRGSFSTRWASPEKLLRPSVLNELSKFSERLETIQRRHDFGGERWLGELGPALYGGEPGLSDRYISGLWWLDALGSAACSGNTLVARQTLFGSEYGLLSSESYAANPDYWNSVLWKRLMGDVVYSVDRTTLPDFLRLYCHGRSTDNRRTLLCINTSRRFATAVDVQGFVDGARSPLCYRVDGTNPFGRSLRINGIDPNEEEAAVLDHDIAQLGTPLDGAVVELQPLSYCFVQAEGGPELTGNP